MQPLQQHNPEHQGRFDMAVRDATGLNSADVSELARVDETGPGSAWLKIGTAILAKHEREYRAAPQMNDLDIRKDLRYRLGIIDGLELALSIPGMAQRMMDDLRKGKAQ